MERRQIKPGEKVRKAGVMADGIAYISETYFENFVVPFTEEELAAIEKDFQETRKKWAIPQNQKPRNGLRGLFIDKTFES